MLVPPKTQILHKGVWYNTGDELPTDYKPPKEKKFKTKSLEDTTKKGAE